MFLSDESDEQLALEPRFGSEERLQQSIDGIGGLGGIGSEDVPDLARFYRVRGSRRAHP